MSVWTYQQEALASITENACAAPNESVQFCLPRSKYKSDPVTLFLLVVSADYQRRIFVRTEDVLTGPFSVSWSHDDFIENPIYFLDWKYTMIRPRIIWSDRNYASNVNFWIVVVLCRSFLSKIATWYVFQSSQVSGNFILPSTVFVETDTYFLHLFTQVSVNSVVIMCTCIRKIWFDPIFQWAILTKSTTWLRRMYRKDLYCLTWAILGIRLLDLSTSWHSES